MFRIKGAFMQKTKRNTALLSCLLIVLSLGLIISATFAYFTDSRNARDPISFGKIEISEEEPIIKEVSLSDALPGDSITSAVSFSKAVDSEAMYVRVKIAYTTESQEQAIQDLVSEMNGYDLNVSASETADYKWSDRYGSYYYLLDATTSNAYSLDTLEEITLSNGFIIPRELKQLPDYAQYFESIKLVIEIQAVQSANVTDDVEELDVIFTELFGESAEFPPPYTFGELEADHASGKKYYVEMGEYPQSLASVSSSDVTATSEQITIYDTACTVYQNNTTDDRYVLYDSNYYLIEPVRWIILGYEEGYDTSTYKFANFTIDGQNAYIDTAKSTPYTGTNGQPGLLLLSEKVLNRSVFNSTFANQYSNSTLKVTIDRMYGELFTSTEQSLIKSTTVNSTYYDGSIRYGGDSVTTKLFPLGYQYDAPYTDNYDVNDYLTTESERVAYATELVSSSGSPYSWWLRSGSYNISNNVHIVYTSGSLIISNVRGTNGVRVACVMSFA